MDSAEKNGSFVGLQTENSVKHCVTGTLHPAVEHLF